MLLTIVGMLKGSKVRVIGDFDYAYPILKARDTSANFMMIIRRNSEQQKALNLLRTMGL